MKKLIPIVVITLVLFSLAGEIQAQNEPNNINSTQSKNENELNDKVKATKETEKITNIKDISSRRRLNTKRFAKFATN